MTAWKRAVQVVRIWPTTTHQLENKLLFDICDDFHVFWICVDENQLKRNLPLREPYFQCESQHRSVRNRRCDGPKTSLFRSSSPEPSRASPRLHPCFVRSRVPVVQTGRRTQTPSKNQGPWKSRTHETHPACLTPPHRPERPSPITENDVPFGPPSRLHVAVSTCQTT